jgi:hypothetical protein
MHKRCDAKGPVLVLCQTKKNVVFGAYSDIGIDSVGGWRKSLKSYMFTLRDIAVKFEVNKEMKQFALYFQEKYGVVMGKNDLSIDFSDIGKSCSKLGNVYSIPGKDGP